MDHYAVMLSPLVFQGLTSVVSLRAFFLPAPESMKMLSRIWIAAFLVELMGFSLKQQGTANLWLYNAFTPFYYIFLANVYQHELRSSVVRGAIQIFYGVFLLFFIFNSIFLQGFSSELQTLTLVAGRTFIIFLAVLNLWQLNATESVVRVTREPFFWISIGLIIYFGGTLPFLGMFNYLWDNFRELTQFYLSYCSAAFSIILSLLVIIGFLCRKKYQKSYSS